MKLCKSLIDELGVDIRSPEAITHAAYIFRYISGIDNAFAFQRHFKPLCVSAKNYRLSLISKAYFSVKLKYAFIACGLSSVTSEEFVRIQNDFGIDRNDMVMLKRVILMRGMRSLIKNLGYKKADVTLSRYNRDMSVFGTLLYKDVKRVASSIARKRMRFISTANNVAFSDLTNELICKALTVFYSKMPLEQPVNMAHLKNSIMLSMNNHAVNMIEESTSAKRGRLVQGAADGFGGNNYDLIVVSDNQLKSEDGALTYDDLGNDGSDFTEKLDYERIMARYGNVPSRRQFLLLITGHCDDKFTDYLRKKRCLRAAEDSQDYCERASSDEYMGHVSEYLGIDKALARSFLSFLGQSLGR